MWLARGRILNSAGKLSRFAEAKSESAKGGPVVVSKRLQSELMALMMAGDAGISAFPDGDSLFSWVGTIAGAAGTVYEGMRFKMSLRFPTVSITSPAMFSGGIRGQPSIMLT